MNTLEKDRMATLLLNREHRIKRFTPAMLEIYNLIDSDIGSCLEHITHVAETMPPIPTVQQSLDCVEIKHEFRMRDSRCNQRRTLPYTDNKGAIEGQVLTVPDITHTKLVEQFTRNVIDSLYCFVGVCDTQGIVLEANRSMLETSGLAPDEVFGKPFRDMFWWSHSFESQSQLDKAIAQAIAGHISRFDATVRMADERLAIIDFQMAPMRDCEGTVTHLIASAIDVTERRHVEASLARSEEKTRGLLSQIEEIYSNAPIGLCVLDNELRYVRINKHLADMNGLPVEAHLGKTIAELLPELAASIVPALQQVIDSGQAMINVYISGETPREPGVLRHWLESCLPMKNSKGEIFGVNIVAEEVTGQKRHEAQLLAIQSAAEAALCAAEQASRSKSEFLASMSHEIRTPMTAILGYADLLALHLKDPDNLQSVQTIKRNGHFLVDLLDDILDLSRIEAGKMTLETHVFDPVDVVEQTRELMQVRADQQQLIFHVHYASKLPAVMHTDPTRLRQILVNLINNAIKFTEHGSVTLRVDYVAEPEPSLRFAVTDTGIGMNDKQRTEVFEAFTQANSSICRRFGGSGLGLAISKRLIDMLGGNLSIDSTLGAGTTVTLFVPVGPVATLVLKTPTIRKAAMPIEEQSSIRLPYRILIVDDRRDVRHMVQCVLEKAGAEVISANTGSAALQHFSASAEKPYDVMLLDMHMPDINGFEVARQLRASGVQLPIIALTADAMMGTREKCLAAGCNDYFTKPIDQAALLTCLHRHLQGSFSSNGASHQVSKYETSSGQPTESLSIESGRAIDSGSECILVVEDDHATACILASLLQEYGHTAHYACSAQKARALLERVTPSLVLSDISLPDEDGYSLVASLRERPELAHCRFIALTGCDTLDKARGMVFEAHIIKPFDIQALLTLIDDSGASSVLDKKTVMEGGVNNARI